MLNVQLEGPPDAVNFAKLTSSVPLTEGSAELKLGTAFTITATANPGFLFNGWTLPAFGDEGLPGWGLTPQALQVQKLTFTPREFLDLTAHFVANPFPTTPGLIGSFNGLVLPASGVASKVDTVGLLTATVTGTGAFSASLKIDGATLALKGGIFDAEGVARFGADRA
jgi:hypothetical protein